MRLHRPFAVVASFVAVMVLARPTAAQATRDSLDSHRRALFLSVEGAAVPDPFSTRCGRGSGDGLGWGPGAALLVRPQPWLILQGDARVVMATVDNFGCYADLPIVQIDSNTYETRPGADFPGSPGYPFATTALRVGFETQPGVPLVRATVGGGFAWGRRPAPIGLMTLGIGSRGPGKRFYLEFERLATRVNATERRSRMRVGPTGSVDLGTSVVPVVIHASGGALRAGIEVPLAR